MMVDNKKRKEYNKNVASDELVMSYKSLTKKLKKVVDNISLNVIY